MTDEMKDRTLVTRFGTLILPRWNCLCCISTGTYMSCTACDFMREMSRKAKVKFEETWAKIIGEEQ